MKHLLLQSLACSAVLLSMSQADAKTFGGFSVGQTFSFKVTEATSVKKTGYFGVETKVPVPASVPKFTKGKTIGFKIGKGGKLTGDGGLRIPFAHGTPKANEYNLYKPGDTTITHNAEITKGAKNKPTGGKLSFFISSYEGVEPVFYTVTYTVE